MKQTPKARFSRWCQRLLLGSGLALCIPLTGCGVADYEAKMSSEQARLLYFDEETRCLDAPLEMPRKKKNKDEEVPAFGADLFIRGPLGIKKLDENPISGNSYRYTPSGLCLFQELRLTATDSDRQDFRKEVLQPYSAVDPNNVSKVRPRVAPGRKPIEFDRFSYSEQSGTTTINYYIHIGSLAGPAKMQVGVVFKLDKARDTPAAKEQMEYCLASVATGGDISQLKKAYRLRFQFGGANAPRTK